jgi:hypothetical protein
MSKSQGTRACFFAVVIGASFLFANTARAEYRCDAPPTEIDHMACKKAKQGPDALRQYIQRMRVIESLYFFDYVNEERLIAWRDLERKVEPSPYEQEARISE